MNGRPTKRVVLGVTGGIAAYKSPDVVRRLRERGHDVRVVMTRAGQSFIAPLTLQAVSGHPVHTELLDEHAEAGMGHIELARWAELVLVAPASADFLARIAHGLADDLLTTICLATAAPIVAAPAMNRQMWSAPATVDNVRALEARGVRMLGPGEGDQACGEVGEGRMLEPAEIAALVDASAPSGPLAGARVLVTAGPTREAIDPVRYLSNHSSGKMGYAVARAAREAGARVTLVSGPCSLEAPPGAEVVMVETAAQMRDAVMARIGESDVLVAAAAVADYRPAERAGQKIKKTAGNLSVELVRTPDILAEVAATADPPFTVGFAAETENLEANARAKLEAKSLDMIAANAVGSPEVGFGTDLNELHLYWAGGDADLGRAPKTELARRLIARIAERYREKHPA